MTNPEDMRNAVRAHLDHFWPDRPQEEFCWSVGPVNDHLPGFRVRRIAPTLSSEPWVYVTIGAAAAGTKTGQEFFILAIDESAEHVENLAMVANFHADVRHGLGVGKTVAIGRPWVHGASADSFMASLPYPYGPALETCAVDGHLIQLLWLVPITSRELRYAEAHGIDALEQLLEESGVDVVSPTRNSVV